MGACKVPVSAGGMRGVHVLLDSEDVERLGSRRLSLGSHGYAQMRDSKRVTLVHRWVIGAQPRDGKIVDHINGDKLDCRRINLRIVTASESSANVRATASSGYRGVYPMRKKWQARGKVNGRSTNLGVYDSPQQAAWVAHMWRIQNLPGYHGRDRITNPTAAMPIAA